MKLENNKPKYTKKYRKIVKKFKKAEEKHMKCRERRIAVLGEEHIDSLGSLANLALYHKTMTEIYGKYVGVKDKEEHLKEYYKNFQREYAYHQREAERYFEECIRKRQNVLGIDHPETLKTQFSFAELMHARKQWRQAEPLYQQCLDRRRTKLGQYSPFTIFTINAFATMLAGMKVSKALLQKSTELEFLTRKFR